MKTLLRTLCAGLPLLVVHGGFAQPATLNQVDAKGKKQGAWERNWADSQQLRYSGTFKDDKPVGRFTYYSTKGKLESILDHYPTGDASHARHYHANGKLKAEGRYAGKDKDSTWVYFDESGRQRSSEQWVRGRQHGEEVVLYPEGGVAERTLWKNGVRDGKSEQFHPNGKPKLQATYSKGEPEGTMTWYYPNGKKEIEGKMVNGARDGSWYYYHEDGLVQIQVLYAQGNYVKDKKENGVFKEYYGDDKLKSEHNYKAGKLDGPFVEYNDDGRWVERPVKVGPEFAEQKQEVEQVLQGQTKRREGTYVAGALHGELKEYDEKGKLLSVVRYVNGETTQR